MTARRANSHVVYLDPDPNPPLVIPNPTCPRADLHTPEPAGYLEHHEWMDRQVREKHYPSMCPACGLWVIWS